jgi:hypothetical protein
LRPINYYSNKELPLALYVFQKRSITHIDTAIDRDFLNADPSYLGDFGLGKH